MGSLKGDLGKSEVMQPVRTLIEKDSVSKRRKVSAGKGNVSEDRDKGKLW